MALGDIVGDLFSSAAHTAETAEGHEASSAVRELGATSASEHPPMQHDTMASGPESPNQSQYSEHTARSLAKKPKEWTSTEELDATKAARPTGMVSDPTQLPVFEGPLRAPSKDDPSSYGYLKLDGISNEEYEAARDHLSADPVMRSNFLRMEDGRTPYRPQASSDMPTNELHEPRVTNLRAADTNSASEEGIDWTPDEGTIVYDGENLGGVSAASALGHESAHLMHFADDEHATDMRAAETIPGYDNPEEKSAITLQNNAARNINSNADQNNIPRDISNTEAIRTTHLGVPFNAESVTQTWPSDMSQADLNEGIGNLRMHHDLGLWNNIDHAETAMTNLENVPGNFTTEEANTIRNSYASAVKQADYVDNVQNFLKRQYPTPEEMQAFASGDTNVFKMYPQLKQGSTDFVYDSD